MVRLSKGGSLPNTSYAVLGLLTFGEMFGYDLKRMADGSIRYFFWSPASSQIYGELRRLNSLGYVTEREVAQERRPDKRLYRITPEGRGMLRQWLQDTEVEPDVLKSTFLMKLFFGRMTPHETLVRQIEQRRQQALEALAQLKTIEDNVKDNDKFFFPYLTITAGISNSQARAQWAEDALKELKERPESPPSDN